STDPEFAITVAFVPFTLLVLSLAFWALRRESPAGMWVFVFLLCASTAYFVFKCARMYDPKQRVKYASQIPMMTYYTIVSLVFMAATLHQSIMCLANFGYGLKERIEITRGKRSDMEQIQDYYINAAGDRRMNLDGYSSSSSSSSSSNSEESNGSDGDTDIRQVDLMSGIPTVLVALVAFLQILPSPIKVACSRLEGFLDWLQENIESDFAVKLCACENKCQTQLYEPNKESVEKRIRTNVGAAGVIGCIGKNILTVEDLVKIIQSDNSGSALVRLARVVRYPSLASFSRSVQVLEFCPTYGRRVIIWQWLVVITKYPVFWLLKGGLPTAVYWCCVVIRNLYRRTFNGLSPFDPAHNKRRVGDYCIAELARHRILSQHIPWVRFAIYYMAMELAGKQLSLRSRDLDNANVQATGLPSSLWDTQKISGQHVFQEDTDNQSDPHAPKEDTDNQSDPHAPKEDTSVERNPHAPQEVTGVEINPHAPQEVTGVKSDDKSSNSDKAEAKDGDLAPNENKKAFKNPMYHERHLFTHIATDECSTARLLFSVALHSTRCMLLCSQLGFVPPYILAGSFRTVDHTMLNTTMLVHYNDINVLYRIMYRLSNPVAANNSDDAQKLFPHRGTLRYEYSAYNHLMKGLQSRLGNMITKSSNICLLLNLTLALIPLNDLELYIKANDPELKKKSSEDEKEKGHDNSNSNSNSSSSVIGSTNTNTNTNTNSSSSVIGSTNTNTTTNTTTNTGSSANSEQPFPSSVIDGVTVDSDVYAMLCGGYLKANEKHVKIIDNLAEAALDNIHWGCGTWVLYLFNTALSGNVGMKPLDEKLYVLQHPLEMRAKIILLVSLPYQLKLGTSRCSKESEQCTNIIDLGPKIVTYNPFNDSSRCNSVPAWCLCSGHCRGICTLLISELDMNIPFRWYGKTSYMFSIYRQIEAETQAAASAPAYKSSASSINTIRLVCVTSIEHLELDKAATDNSKDSIPELPVRFEDGQGEIFNVDEQGNGDDNGASKLAEMLYSKKGHVVVICGNTLRARGGGIIVVESGSSDTSSSSSDIVEIWPYNCDKDWKDVLRNSEKLLVKAVERLRLDGSDYQLGQMFATDSIRPEGILPHTRNINLAATGQLVLRRPHRSLAC
ncbi:hypothetical protein H4S06_002236, partial [Coemansia sp. BCRC 34490]